MAVEQQANDLGEGGLKLLLVYSNTGVGSTLQVKNEPLVTSRN